MVSAKMPAPVDGSTVQHHSKVFAAGYARREGGEIVMAGRRIGQEGIAVRSLGTRNVDFAARQIVHTNTVARDISPPPGPSSSRRVKAPGAALNTTEVSISVRR